MAWQCERHSSFYMGKEGWMNTESERKKREKNEGEKKMMKLN